MNTQGFFDDDLPEAGTGHYMLVVVLSYFDETEIEKFEEIRVWFEKRPREGTRFEFRGETWRLDSSKGGQGTAEVWDLDE
ncbi:MAG: hypothetical protein K8R59_04890 [Thermoanaerobaculales bacterium]|nr:hypothetical protein [Thermoanaerobaculales bacterium]